MRNSIDCLLMIDSMLSPSGGFLFLMRDDDRLVETV